MENKAIRNLHGARTTDSCRVSDFKLIFSSPDITEVLMQLALDIVRCKLQEKIRWKPIVYVADRLQKVITRTVYNI